MSQMVSLTALFLFSLNYFIQWRYFLLHLGKNFFSGQMPPSVAMLLDLVVLDLSFNSLVGGDRAIALKDLPSIEEIYLSHNNLTGNIGQLGKSETLRILDLCT